MRAALLTASGVLPYLIESFRTRTFHLVSFVELLALVLVAAFWYVWVRRSMLVDFLFLGFMAAVYLSRPFEHIYGQPAPHVPLAILGQLMWIRLGLMAVLSLRSLDDARFGFFPTSEEWRIGVQHFLFFLPDRRGAQLPGAPGTIRSASAPLVEIRAVAGSHFLGDLVGGIAGRGVFLSRIPATRDRARHAK